MTVDQIAALTDRQLQTIYFHRRDRDGSLEVTNSHEASDGPETVEKALKDWYAVANATGMSLADIQAGRQRILEKFRANQAE